MKDILNTLFLDNPCIPEQAWAFCSQLPEFRKAEQTYENAVEKLRAQLGEAEFNSFDEILTQYLARYVQAYYLFGLHLRQEVLSALGQAG